VQKSCLSFLVDKVPSRCPSNLGVVSHFKHAQFKNYKTSFLTEFKAASRCLAHILSCDFDTRSLLQYVVHFLRVGKMRQMNSLPLSSFKSLCTSVHTLHMVCLLTKSHFHQTHCLHTPSDLSLLFGVSFMHDIFCNSNKAKFLSWYHC
jgi:hypothetical protein